eukprot:759154-Hanusia_phi.AAC.1
MLPCCCPLGSARCSWAGEVRKKFLQAILAQDTHDLETIVLDLYAEGRDDEVALIRDEAGKTVLHHAVDARRPESLEFLARILMQHVDSTDDRGMTPLMLAAKQGEIFMVQVLEKAGAQRYLRCHRGLRAYDYAWMGKHQAVIKYFDTVADPELYTAGYCSMLYSAREAYRFYNRQRVSDHFSAWCESTSQILNEEAVELKVT